jgi:hypothetical protein
LNGFGLIHHNSGHSSQSSSKLFQSITVLYNTTSFGVNILVSINGLDLHEEVAQEVNSLRRARKDSNIQEINRLRNYQELPTSSSSNSPDLIGTSTCRTS